MKKRQIIIISIIILIVSVSARAQEPIFTKDDKVLNFGVGFGSLHYGGGGFRMQVPPISVSFEKGIVENIAEKGAIGIGGYMGYASYAWNDWGWKSSFSNLVIGARGNFHYPIIEKLDTYSGIFIGYEFVKWKDTYQGGTNNNLSSSGGIWAWHVGGRYYFNDKISGMAELGYGITYITIGIGVKF